MLDIAPEMSRFHKGARTLVKKYQGFWKNPIEVLQRTLVQDKIGDQTGLAYMLWARRIELYADFKVDPLAPKKLSEVNSLISVLDHLGVDAKVTNYIEKVGETCLGRRFCITKGASMGLVPPLAKVGDRIALILGAQTPFVLRQKLATGDSITEYELVGECYFWSMMNRGGDMNPQMKERILLV